MNSITVVPVPPRPVVVVPVGFGLQGPPGPDGGLSAAQAQAIATLEAEELRIDLDALVGATLSI